MQQQCTACHKEIASIVIMDLSDGEVVGQHSLCPTCANTMGVPQGGKKSPTFYAQIVEDLLGLPGVGGREGKGRSGGCPACGMTVQDFKIKGRLGCPRCYETFHAELMPLLQRIHEASSHRGRLPSRPPAMPASMVNRLADLRRRLEDAVRGERYEEAAQLRDELRKMESVPGGDTEDTRGSVG